jgi:CHAT domain-containing protein/cytochrome c-type biogenesis protein CcmH/NrfG
MLCDCGSLLQDLAEEVTDQESAQLCSLASVQPEGQQSLAQKLSAAQSDRGKRRNAVAQVGEWIRNLAERFAWQPRSVFRYAWAYAAAAVVLIVAGVWAVQTRRAPSPSIDQLIASAYTEQRPFELRIAGAAYGPVRQERSGERSAFAAPADLLRAQYLIKERLAAHPDDEAILAASGRVELLEGHYDESIRTFGRLLDVHPDSPALLKDLAIAYFQRAEAGDRAMDYGQTIELLSRALAKNPDDLVALFNRAIALEKMYVYNEAIRDWEHYLRVDPSSDWAGEVRKRLSELREKMKAREKPASLLKSDPVVAAPLLRARATGLSSSSTPWAASLDEEYLDLAVREWLPLLYVPIESADQKGWHRDPVVWDALAATADVLRTHHRDRWLADLLRDLPRESASPKTLGQIVAALDSLARAAKANAAGNPDSARPLAESATRSFRTAGSAAGFLRAREEILYSLVRGVGQVQDCLQAARQQLRETKLDSYTWLKGQAILWQATCQGFVGDLDLAQHLSERAVEFTRRAGYAGQHLRSVLFASGFLRSAERNWQDTWAGLRSFWSDWHDPFHAYESYSELASLAEGEEKWHLAYLLCREALGMIERTADRSYGAVAHYYLAVAATKARDITEAEAQFKIASQHFATFPDSPTIRLYRAGAEIHLARVEFQQDRFGSAEALLEQARPHLASISTTWAAFHYYQVLGQLHAGRRKFIEAEKALWSAVQIGEIRLSSLESDTDRMAWERDAAIAYRTLVELYARKPDTTVRALELWEWYRSSALRGANPSALPTEHGFGDSVEEPGSPFLSEVRDTLPALKRETVISFAILPSGVAAWAFDDRGVNFAWVRAPEEELTRRTKRFAHLCANPSSNLTKLQQEGRNLYDLLLAPFEQQLQATRLLILEPDSVLSEVPWSALVDPRGEYLGSRFAIVISPGLGYWQNLHSPSAISPEQRVLVVGMPALAAPVAARFSPLPDADREARGVAARFQHSRLLLSWEVTADAIRKELPRSNVFHFAGHAISDGRDTGLVMASPSEPGQETEEPTLLSASQLQEVAQRQLQLVVLSACATAETEKGFTEPDTLVRGFLRAGVPNVVASLWPVDSRTTEQTMTKFYSLLFEGQQAASALQRTTNALRRQPATAHPYYWAAFSAYGR